MISVIAILIPAGYSAAFNGTQAQAAEESAILSMSRGTSVILLLIYGAYRAFKLRLPLRKNLISFPLSAQHVVIFQLFTHQHLYSEATDDTAAKEGMAVWGMGDRRALKQARSVRRRGTVADLEEDEDEEEEIPKLNLYSGLLLLGGVTVRTTFVKH